MNMALPLPTPTSAGKQALELASVFAAARILEKLKSVDSPFPERVLQVGGRHADHIVGDVLGIDDSRREHLSHVG